MLENVQTIKINLVICGAMTKKQNNFCFMKS